MPVSARRNLAASLLFTVHPLLALTPTDDFLDAPGDHPHTAVKDTDWLQNIPPVSPCEGFEGGSLWFREDAPNTPEVCWFTWLVDRWMEFRQTLKEPMPPEAPSDWLHRMPRLCSASSVTGPWRSDFFFEDYWTDLRFEDWLDVMTGRFLERYPAPDSQPSSPEQTWLSILTDQEAQLPVGWTHGDEVWHDLWWDEETGCWSGFPIISCSKPVPSSDFLLAMASPGDPDSEYIPVMPKEDTHTPVSVCPFCHPQAANPPRRPTDADLVPDVLTNLERIAEADSLMQWAGELARMGFLEEAFACYDLICHMVPGSRLDTEASEASAEMLAKFWGQTNTAVAAAEESSESRAECCQQLCDVCQHALCVLRLAMTPAEVCEALKGNSTPKTVVKRLPIEEALQRHVTLCFVETPCKAILEDLRNNQNINIFVDQRSLEEAGISLERPVTIHVQDVSLEAALKLVVQPLHLVCAARDEVLVISTEDRGAPLLRQVYAVADLVKDDPEKDPASLMHIITSSIEPTRWAEMGGAGRIDYFPPKKALVICQTADVQEQVADLLMALRRLEDKEDTLPESKPDAPWYVRWLRLLPLPRFENLYSPDPNARILQLLNESEDLRQIEREWQRVWSTDQPAHLTPAEKKDPGVEAQLAGLMKACRLSMEAGDLGHAAEMARQAHALDPAGVQADPVVGAVYRQLVQAPAKCSTPSCKSAASCPICKDGRAPQSDVAEEAEAKPDKPGSLSFGLGVDDNRNLCVNCSVSTRGRCYHLYFVHGAAAVWMTPENAPR
jgi:hypothetical protein